MLSAVGTALATAQRMFWIAAEARICQASLLTNSRISGRTSRLAQAWPGQPALLPPLAALLGSLGRLVEHFLRGTQCPARGFGEIPWESNGRAVRKKLAAEAAIPARSSEPLPERRNAIRWPSNLVSQLCSSAPP